MQAQPSEEMIDEGQNMQSLSEMVQPQPTQQQEPVPEFYAMVTFRIQMGEAPANWTLFASLTKRALESTFSYTSVKILGTELAPCRRLNADATRPKTRVAIRFSARKSSSAEFADGLTDVDASNLPPVMQDLLDKAGSDIVLLSMEARECPDASCESFGGSGGSGAESIPWQTGEEESPKAAGPPLTLIGMAAAFAAVIIALVTVVMLVVRRRRAARNAAPSSGDPPAPTRKPSDGDIDLEVPKSDDKLANSDIASNSTIEPSNKDGDSEIAEDEH